MRRFIMVTAAAAAVATLGALSPATADAAGHALRAGPGASGRAGQAASGARQWLRRYNGAANGQDYASSVAVSRTRVFVTGTILGQLDKARYATVAYSAATGRQLWVRQYKYGYAYSIVVNTAGTAVFVTGGGGTVAYRAATGRQLWARRKLRDGRVDSIAVNAAGTAVFVTGLIHGTAAYSAATGRQLWASSSGGNSVAVNHRGTAVFVTGDSLTAYSAATGTQLWARPIPGHAPGLLVAVNAAGTTVFVTGGGVTPADARLQYATAAYSASTGTQLWASYYTLPGDTLDAATSVVVNPAGTAVFVTGIREFFGPNDLLGDYATVAYDAATGSQLWVRGYAGATNDTGFLPPALAVSPDGTRVYFTGSSGGYRTLAYSAATGTTLWARHYPRKARM
jgi:PQQ-like domain